MHDDLHDDCDWSVLQTVAGNLFSFSPFPPYIQLRDLRKHCKLCDRVCQEVGTAFPPPPQFKHWSQRIVEITGWSLWTNTVWGNESDISCRQWRYFLCWMKSSGGMTSLPFAPSSYLPLSFHFTAWYLVVVHGYRIRSLIHRSVWSRLHSALPIIRACGCLRLRQQWRVAWHQLVGYVTNRGLTTLASASLLLI